MRFVKLDLWMVKGVNALATITCKILSTIHELTLTIGTLAWENSTVTPMVTWARQGECRDATFATTLKRANCTFTFASTTIT